VPTGRFALFAVVAVGAVSAGAVLWLGYWLVTLHTFGDGPAASLPPWYTDPLDVSWQVSLEPNATSDLGLRSSHPVEVCGVLAQQAYLASIACDADPAAVPFTSPFDVSSAKRESVPAPFGFRYVDRFEVPCPGRSVQLFLSPYRCRGESTRQVPEGFVPRFR